jgi:hypothetical protein
VPHVPQNATARIILILEGRKLQFLVVRHSFHRAISQPFILRPACATDNVADGILGLNDDGRLNTVHIQNLVEVEMLEGVVWTAQVNTRLALQG